MTAPFDPATWLRDFTAAGGSCSMEGDQLVSHRSFWGTTRAQQDEAFRLEEDLRNHPIRVELVAEFLGAREPFDPADWLRRFADAGGYVMPARDGRVAAGWMFDDEEQMMKARAIWAEIDPYPERRAALRAMVRGAAA